jgi:hypothetical protein
MLPASFGLHLPEPSKAAYLVMKKLYTQNKWKEQSRRRQNDELERRRERNKFVREVRKSTNRLPRRLSSGGTPWRKYEVIQVPNDFSFINNTEEMIKFFNKMGRRFGKKKHLSLDLSNISSITADALAVLISKLKDRRFTNGMSYKGNEPIDPVLKEQFIHSGFYDHVATASRDSTTNVGSIRAKKKSKEVVSRRVEPETAYELISFVTTKLYGKYRKAAGAYNCLLEAMTNTREHASSMEARHESWWASVLYNGKEKKGQFTFVDNGVGIFASRDPNVLQQTLNALGIRNNISLLRKMLRREIPSSTNIAYRGRGIPSMYKALQRGEIHNLIIITNDVYANVAEDRYRNLDPPFSGTFIYWEIKR